MNFTRYYINYSILFLSILFVSNSTLSIAAEESLGWPREVQADNVKILMYQPQVETFVGDKLTGRAAVSVTMKDSVNPVFGVVS